MTIGALSATFSAKALTLDEAVRQHKMVADAAESFYRKAGDAGRTVETSRPVAEEAWQALIGAPDATGVVADAIRWTIPAQVIPMMRRSDCIPAAFAFVHLSTELAQVDATDDLKVRGAVRRAWAMFERRRLEANHVEEGFGCDDSQSWHTLRDIVEGAGGDSLKKKMLAIAELAGKMFDALAYTKKKVESDDPQEVRSTKLGGDVTRLLPAEYAKMSTARTRDLTTMRVIQKRAQQFKMKGERTKSRGPMVVALDESGSMHDSAYGVKGRNCWSKAAAVALTRVAWGENRPVRVVHFGNAATTQIVPKDDLDALFEMARSFLSGGTDISKALKTSRKQVGDLEKAGYKGADIVLISDGEEPDYDEHNREIDAMDKDDIRLWTVAIGNRIQKVAPVRARAERYIEARDSDLANGEIAGELVAELKGAALSKPSKGLLN